MSTNISKYWIRNIWIIVYGLAYLLILGLFIGCNKVKNNEVLNSTNPAPASQVPVIKYTPISVITITSLSTKIYRIKPITSTVTPISISTSSTVIQTIMPSSSPIIFSDEFSGETINTKFWKDKDEGMAIKDGKLYISFENKLDESSEYRIEAKLQNKRFSTIEFKAEIIKGSKNDFLGVTTNCSNDDLALYFELRPNNLVTGYYDDPNGKQELEWGKLQQTGKIFIIRLVQDNDVVRAYVNEKELSDVYQCPSMGKWLVIEAFSDSDTTPQNAIEGYIDYVTLFK